MEEFYGTDWEGIMDFDSAVQFLNWKIREFINDWMSASEPVKFYLTTA